MLCVHNTTTNSKVYAILSNFGLFWKSRLLNHQKRCWYLANELLVLVVVVVVIVTVVGADWLKWCSRGWTSCISSSPWMIFMIDPQLSIVDGSPFFVLIRLVATVCIGWFFLRASCSKGLAKWRLPFDFICCYAFFNLSRASKTNTSLRNINKHKRRLQVVFLREK